MKINNEEIFLKLEEENKKKEKEPLSFFSMNNMIFEDNPNKTIKIYDSTLFNNMNIFKIEKVENIESDNEPQY